MRPPGEARVCQASLWIFATILVAASASQIGVRAVQIPVDLRLPERVHKVVGRAKGSERIISPAGQE